MHRSHLKRVSTVLERYGVDNVAKLEEVQQKRQQTFASHRNTLHIEYPHVDHVLDGHQLEVYRLNKRIADTWLNQYHPLKAPKGNVMCLGLVKDTTIYCLMTFKKSRDPHYVAELSRMWMLPGYYVQDGYDILSKIAADLGLYAVVAYVHVPIEDPADYIDIGMHLTRVAQRTKWWMNEDVVMSDACRRQKHIDSKFLSATGWRCMYDESKLVYEFK